MLQASPTAGAAPPPTATAAARAAARKAAHELFTASHDSQVRPTVEKGGPEGLTFRNSNIDAQFARTLKNSQADRIKDVDHQGSLLMCQFYSSGNVFQAPEEIGMLNDNTGSLVIQFRIQHLQGKGSRGSFQGYQLGFRIAQVGLEDLPIFRVD